MIREFLNEQLENDFHVDTGTTEEEIVKVDVSEEEIPENTQFNPVEQAKKDPNTVPVAVKADAEGVKEYYVDAADVAKFSEVNEFSMLEGLNAIIACNEEYGMTASNVVVVMSEGTQGYVRNLERHGAACVSYMYEADDITIDVQVGPNKEEETVTADPQDANPVDAVKRQYDSVVVAKDGDDFFMDVEDVQKCAELNCESMIETLNGIIAANEEYDMCAEHCVVIVNENTDDDAICTLDDAGVNIGLNEAGTTIGDISGMNILATKMISNAKKIVGTIKGDKKASEKAIRAQIESLEKTISRIDEEIDEISDPNYKIKPLRIAKYFIGMMIVFTISDSIGVASGAAGGYLGTSLVFGADVAKAAIKNIGFTLVAVTAAISTIASTVETAKFFMDYKKSLITWKKALTDNKKILEDKLG